MGVDGCFVCPCSLSWFNTWNHRAVASALAYPFWYPTFRYCPLPSFFSIPLCWRILLRRVGLEVFSSSGICYCFQADQKSLSCLLLLFASTYLQSGEGTGWTGEQPRAPVAPKPVLGLFAVLYKRWQLSSLALEKKLDKMQRLWREAVILQQFWAAK